MRRHVVIHRESGTLPGSTTDPGRPAGSSGPTATDRRLKTHPSSARPATASAAPRTDRPPDHGKRQSHRRYSPDHQGLLGRRSQITVTPGPDAPAGASAPARVCR